MRKHKFELEGFEVKEDVAKSRNKGTASYLYLPKHWIGKKVAVVRLEE